MAPALAPATWVFGAGSRRRLSARLHPPFSVEGIPLSDLPPQLLSGATRRAAWRLRHNPQHPERPQWLKTLLEALPALIFLTTLAGFLLYSLLRIQYEFFYDTFRLNPEDVGIDQQLIIAQAAGTLGQFLFLLLIFGLILFSSPRRCGYRSEARRIA